MRIYLKWGPWYIGVDPSHPGVVYADRPKGGAWEVLELTPRGEFFGARFVAADRVLAITPEGRLETRPAGTEGPWESHYATTQPDGLNFLYRREGPLLAGAVLVLEEA